MRWRIRYSDHAVEGSTREDWVAAPDDDVQVVSVLEPYPDGRCPWIGVEDRQLWTGPDTFDPASEQARREVPSLPSDWPPKHGRLLPDADYHMIWEEEAHGTH